MRVGLGFDVHRVVKGRKLILGGVRIPYEKGLLGVSDADVVLHSVCDAIWGALALGDIGDYFPPESPKCKDISSSLIVNKVLNLIKKHKINNLDVTIILEKPRLRAHKEKIRKSISRLLKISLNRISVKVKSQEGLIPPKDEAIFCFCLVSIK
jgi:2-C-methyl-D-erythritol 2,4-cyclodiphosphate synthase